MMNLIAELFSTKGRVDRQAFIFGALFSLVGTATLPAFVRILGMYYDIVPDPKPKAYLLVWVAVAVFVFFVAMLSLAAFALLTIKRQQDRDRNPLWLLLLPGVLSAWYIASYNELTLDADQSLSPIGLFFRAASALVWAIFLGDLCLIKGTPGPNRFGPDPLTAQHSPLQALLRSPMPVRNLLLGLKKRINRAPYWIVTIGAYVIGFGLLILAAAGNYASLVDGDPATIETGHLAILVTIIALTFLGLILFLYVQITIMAKRLHDRNKSAWWVLFYFAALSLPRLFPDAGMPDAGRGMTASGTAADMVAIVVWLWFFVELGFFKGTQGPNRFGPDPLGAKVADARL